MMRTGLMRRVALPCSVVVALVAAAGAVAAVDVDIQPRQLADVAPGAASGMITTSTFTGMNGQAYFRATNGTTYQLWRSSGRARGTFAIPGSEGIASDPVAMSGASSVMFFTGTGTLRPLKAYDAVNKQVVMISPSAMAPIPQSSSVDATTPQAAARGFAMAGTRALFIAPVGTTNTLWATDGTVAGTGPVADPASGTVGNITPAGQSVYYTTRSTTNVYTLWRTDGTPMSPVRVADLRSAPTWSVDSSGMRSIGERVLFSQTVAGNTGLTEVWVSDGTSEGTHAVAQTPVQTSVLPFAIDGNGLFSTRMTATAMEMWRMSPNPAECVNLMNFARVTRFMSFGSYGNISLFGDAGGSQYNTNTSNAVTIWVTDGTAQNTLGIPNFPGAPASTNTSMIGISTGTPASVMAGDTLYVDSAVGSGGHEPWRINLTTGAIGVLRDIQPGGASSNPTKFFALDHNRGAAFFAYDTPGHYALYASNGTPEGTRLMSRLAGVPYQYSPKSIGSRVFLVGMAPTGGNEPYAVDLCRADYDNSSVVNVDDLFAYLTDWFAGVPDADVQGSIGLPDMSDLMAFINTWLTPCE